MGQLCGAEEVDVHLAAQGSKFHIDEELRGGHAGDLPNNVQRLAAVPGGGFLQQLDAKVVLAHIASFIGELLGFRAFGRSLIGRRYKLV